MKTCFVLVAALAVVAMVECETDFGAKMSTIRDKLASKRSTGSGDWPDAVIELMELYGKCIAADNRNALMGVVPDGFLATICPETLMEMSSVPFELLDFDTMVQISDELEPYFKLYQCSNLQGDLEVLTLYSMAFDSTDGIAFENSNRVVFNKCLDVILHTDGKRDGLSNEDFAARGIAESLQKVKTAV